MKNKNKVTGNLLLGCTVLRITPEFPGADMNAGIGCLPFECFPRHTEFRHAQLGLAKPDYSTLAKYKYIVCVYSIIFGVTY